jgi:hypothetical protein
MNTRSGPPAGSSDRLHCLQDPREVLAGDVGADPHDRAGDRDLDRPGLRRGRRFGLHFIRRGFAGMVKFDQGRSWGGTTGTKRGSSAKGKG